MIVADIRETRVRPLSLSKHCVREKEKFRFLSYFNALTLTWAKIKKENFAYSFFLFFLETDFLFNFSTYSFRPPAFKNNAVSFKKCKSWFCRFLFYTFLYFDYTCIETAFRNDEHVHVYCTCVPYTCILYIYKVYCQIHTVTITRKEFCYIKEFERRERHLGATSRYWIKFKN